VDEKELQVIKERAEQVIDLRINNGYIYHQGHGKSEA